MLQDPYLAVWKILEKLPLPVFMVDKSWTIIKINSPCRSLFDSDENFESTHLQEILLSSDQHEDLFQFLFTSRSNSGFREFTIKISDLKFKSVGFRPYAPAGLGDQFSFVLCHDMTALAQTRNYLKKSENRFRELIQNSSLGLLEVDSSEIIQYANQSFCNLTGYSPEEIVGQHAPSLFLTADDKASSELIGEVQQKRRSGISDAYELRIKAKNGEFKWVLISGAPIYNYQDQIEGSIGIHLDITLQKKEADVRLRLLEELDKKNTELEKQKEYLNLIFEFAAGLLAASTTASIYKLIYATLPGQLGFTDCIVYHFNPIRQQLEWDSQFNELPDPIPDDLDAEISVTLGQGITGSAAQEKKPLWIKDTSKDIRYIPDRFFQNIKQGISRIDHSTRILRRSEIAVPIILEGELFGLIDAGNPLPDYFEQHHFETIVTIANLAAVQLLSIRQRNTLAENEKQLSSIIESSLDAIITTDVNLQIVKSNSKAIELFGYPSEKLIGSDLAELISASSRDLFRRQISEVNLERQYIREELNCLIHDGSEFLAELTVSLIFIQGKKFFSVFIRDITVAKRAEVELRKALQKEADLNQLKTRFITLTSHEFRTPLTTIQSSADLMSLLLNTREFPQTEKLEKYISRITKEVGRLTGLMNDILVLGRIEAGRIAVNLSKIDLVSLIREILDTGNLAEADNRKIILNISGSPEPVSADPALLIHIFQNLLSNALKYSAGKPSPQISLEYTSDRCIISVRDFGIGIPKADQHNLFQTFYRASNVENIKGTGLGLTIVKQFVELHGGNLFVESAENSGTCFTFELYL